ncbi:MAG: phosphoadenosine phosphosulfate reductase family protein [Candidatus Lokiarchaeota archaeon]
MRQKVQKAKKLIKDTLKKYPNTAVACSFGKDSIVTVHLAQEIDKNIPVFSIMTMYKPKDTFKYLVKMKKEMNINLKVFYVGEKPPFKLQRNNINVILLDPTQFKEKERETLKKTDKNLYDINPDECCKMLKVEPTRIALKDLECWICGLRNTEGRTRKGFQEIEKRGNLIKLNPILSWTEADVWRYMAINKIEHHPWYELGYRSLGCAPCSNPGGVLERDGRWKGTSKCGGECGIHTQILG